MFSYRLYKTLRYTREAAAYRQHGRLDVLGQSFDIGAGNDDSIDVYHDRESIFVVSENSRLDYIGLEMFDRKTGERIFDIFFDSASSDDVDYLLGLSRVPTKIRYMMQWFN